MRRWLLLLAVLISVLAADQISKQLVIDHLQLGESVEPIPALSEVFKFTRSYNTGIAFGFLPESSDLFLVIAVVIVAAMLYYFPRIPQEAIISRFATGMVAGGAIGNALDRIRHEHVIDFIHYRIPGVISNISNLADHAIVLGVLLIVYDSWRLEQLEKARKASEEAEAELAVAQDFSEES